MKLSEQTKNFFSEEGPLSEVHQDYGLREGQVEMAEKIADSYEGGKHLVVEAGTGIGKSFAYLVPSLLGKEKGLPVIVSTGTISLQEQLANKDIPLLLKSLKKPLRVELAIGRGHYLCENRLRKIYGLRNAYIEDGDDLIVLDKIYNRLGSTSIFKDSNIPGKISSSLWSHIQSEPGLCGGELCRKTPCSYVRARKRVNEADIIVVNHSLLMLHLALKKSGGSLLPKFKRVIIDEAHHLHNIASESFGIAFSSTRVKFLLDRMFSSKGKGFFARVDPKPSMAIEKIETIKEASHLFFDELHHWLESAESKNGRMKEAKKFPRELEQELTKLSDLLNNWASSASRQDEEIEFRHYSEKCRGLAEEFSAFVDQKVPDAAYWVEKGKDRGALTKISARVASLNIAEELKRILFDEYSSVIMTSATLSASAKKPLSYFQKQVGADRLPALNIDSPFPYKDNVRVMTSKKMPSPTNVNYEEALLDFIVKGVELTQGGVFVLVTSYKLLRKIYDRLRPLAREKKYPLYGQGLDGSRTEILDRFRARMNSILVGTQSFWEGVDVPGLALRHVIICRFPFEVPSHPLQEARFERVKKLGGNPFNDLSLPQALIRFRQGIGRLIRRMEDCGIITILDSRLHHSAYGKEFLSVLPPSPVLCDEWPDKKFISSLLNSIKKS